MPNMSQNEKISIYYIIFIDTFYQVLYAPMIWSIKDIKESEKEGQRDRIVILLLFHL